MLVDDDLERDSRRGVTLRDVARLAGVHPGTVSRALNPETRALVNDETARRVLRRPRSSATGRTRSPAG